MNISTYYIVYAIVIFLAGILGTYAYPLIKEKLGDARIEKIKKWTDILVRAAEQIFGEKTGKEKKEYVVDAIKALISKNKKIKITDDQIDALVEAAVNTLFGK